MLHEGELQKSVAHVTKPEARKLAQLARVSSHM
jgi:hypothetical protein